MSETDNTHGSERRLLWALLLTGGFMLAELAGGLLSGSLALLADAGHMLTDTASLFLAWFAARLSRRPADQLRSYGYHRVQILAAFVNGMAFILLVIWIVYEAIQRIMQPVDVLGGIMLVIAVIGLLVNLAAFAILHGGHSHDLNLRGAVIHVLGDLLGSVAAIVAAAVIIWTGWMPIDPLLSIFVAFLILRSAWLIVKESVHILLEGAPVDIDVKLIKSKLIEQIDGVVDVHHVHVWSLTPQRTLLTMHVTVDADADTVEILRQCKQVLVERFNIQHSTVQIESGQCVDH